MLRVVQNGFPKAREAADFYAACEMGLRENPPRDTRLSRQLRRRKARKLSLSPH